MRLNLHLLTANASIDMAQTQPCICLVIAIGEVLVDLAVDLDLVSRVEVQLHEAQRELLQGSLADDILYIL